MKTMSMLSYLPESVLKQLPRRVTFPIAGSMYALTGRADWSKMVITDAVVTSKWSLTGTFQDRVPEELLKTLPLDITFAVDGDEDHWEAHLFGLDPMTFVVADLGIKRDDEKFWSYFMANENKIAIMDYDLVFGRPWGYLAPIFRPVKGSQAQLIRGRRLVVLETAGPGGYIGSVVPSIRLTDIWQVLVQSAKNVSPELLSVDTLRSVRFAVQNPDKPQPREKAVGFSLWEVNLFPALIASGRHYEKGMVKNLYYQCDPTFEAPEGQKFMPLDEYMQYADTPGMSALYQAIVQKFTAYLGVVEGMREEDADFPVNTEESYGTPIRIGIIRHKTTTLVVVKTNQEGRFSRDGVAIPALTACEFDPNIVSAAPKKVHKFWPINPNNQRHTGTHSTAGLYPVEIYEYDSRDIDETGLDLETLCDFTKSGDAQAQSGLFQWIWWTYGPVFEKLNPDTASIPSSTE